MSTDALTCARDDCTAPDGGPCVAGHATARDCPNASQPSVGVPEDSNEAPEVARPEPPAGLRLAPGVALDEAEANALAGREGAHIVMPLGPQRVGKTTLMVELYELFLRGSVGDVSYAFSETLLDFEQIAFAARLASNADVPETWRTRLEDGGRSILHLGLTLAGHRENLLIVNVSGELTDRVRNGKDPSVELPLLASSDRVPICVDGHDVAANLSSSDRAVSKTRQLVRVLTESATFPESAQVALVLTKWDEVHAVDEAVTRWDDAEAELKALVEGIGRPTTALRVAARTIASKPPDDGMAALLQWLLLPRRPEASDVPPPPPSPRAMAQFGEVDA